MTDALTYIRSFDPAYERLEALIERVQKDAYEAGARDATVQMFEIAEQSSARVDEVLAKARSF